MDPGVRRDDEAGAIHELGSSMQTILYCHRESGHSYKVALALTLIGVPFEQRPVDLNLPREQRPEDFRRASMFGEVPALIDEDGLAVSQSNAILDHLTRRYRALDGNAPAAQTRVREWLSWEANRIAMSLPHLRFSRRFTGWRSARNLLDSSAPRRPRSARSCPRRERLSRGLGADDRRYLLQRLSVLGRPGRNRPGALAGGRSVARAHPFAAALAVAV
jgi:glutathione S-transferase